jgi:hypothetical protein
MPAVLPEGVGVAGPSRRRRPLRVGLKDHGVAGLTRRSRPFWVGWSTTYKANHVQFVACDKLHMHYIV